MNINEALTYLKDNYILQMGKSNIIYFKNKKIIIKNKFSCISLTLEDFILLYQNYEFSLIEKDNKTFDEEKDKEYYNFLINRK